MSEKTKGSRRKFYEDKLYRPPSEPMARFLINSLPLINVKLRLDNYSFAKKLNELCKLPDKSSYKLPDIQDTFPWMYQSGLLDIESSWNIRSGYHVLIYRSSDEERCAKILNMRKPVLNGKRVDELGALASKKKIPKCCNDPHIVKSKKTGKRKCKNCGSPVAKKI